MGGDYLQLLALVAHVSRQMAFSSQMTDCGTRQLGWQLWPEGLDVARWLLLVRPAHPRQLGMSTAIVWLICTFLGKDMGMS